MFANANKRNKLLLKCTVYVGLDLKVMRKNSSFVETRVGLLFNFSTWYNVS